MGDRKSEVKSHSPVQLSLRNDAIHRVTKLVISNFLRGLPKGRYVSQLATRSAPPTGGSHATGVATTHR